MAERGVESLLALAQEAAKDRQRRHNDLSDQINHCLSLFSSTFPASSPDRQRRRCSCKPRRLLTPPHASSATPYSAWQ